MAETVGRRLQDLRLQAGLTQEALAALAGLPVNSIRNWEQGQRTPGVLALFKLARALQLPMEKFVEGVAEDPAPKKPRKRKGR